MPATSISGVLNLTLTCSDDLHMYEPWLWSIRAARANQGSGKCRAEGTATPVVGSTGLGGAAQAQGNGASSGAIGNVLLS